MSVEIWDEFGVCRTCRGQGFFVQGGSTIGCPACGSKRVADNSKVQPFVTENKKCPICGGLKYIKACCGQASDPCPICTK